LTLAASPDPILAGEIWTISADIANAGPSHAQDVRVALLLPPGISVAHANPGAGGICVVTTQLECRWTGTTAVASGRGLVAEFRIAPAVPAGTQLTSVGLVAAQTGDDDSNNNSASAHGSVQTSADLQISLQATPVNLDVGAIAELRAQAHNIGPSDAQAMQVEIILGADLRFVGVDAGGADCLLPQIGLGGTVRCRWAGAAAPQTRHELLVRAAGGSDGRAEVTAATSSETADANTSNNRVTTGITIGSDIREIPALDATGRLMLGLLLAALAVRRGRG
jgi:hypothetical protein